MEIARASKREARDAPDVARPAIQILEEMSVLSAFATCTPVCPIYMVFPSRFPGLFTFASVSPSKGKGDFEEAMALGYCFRKALGLAVLFAYSRHTPGYLEDAVTRSRA